MTDNSKSNFKSFLISHQLLLISQEVDESKFSLYQDNQIIHLTFTKKSLGNYLHLIVFLDSVNYNFILGFCVSKSVNWHYINSPTKYNLEEFMTVIEL